MLNRTVLCRMLLVILLLAPGSAMALESEIIEEEIKAEGDSPLSGNVTLENAVGLGSFLENPDTGKMKMPYYALLLTLRATWAFTDDISLRARFDVEKEITSSYGTTTTVRRQIMPSDAFLGLAHARLFHDEWLTGIKLGGDLRFYFPTAHASRYYDRWGGLSARLGLSRRFGGFLLGAGSRYIRYLLSYSHPVVPDYEEHSDQRPCTGIGVEGGTVCGGTANYHTTLIHDFVLSYDISSTITAGIYLFVINRFAYSHEQDELSSAYATGENQRDLTWGIVDLSYQMSSWLSYSIGISSYQPAKTADGASLRFPFWDLEARAENYVTFYLDVHGSF